MSIDYTALKNELQGDPTTLGYAQYLSVGNDNQVCALINAAQSGISVKRSSITNKEIGEAIDVSDYTALPANPNNTQLSTERRYLSWFEGIMGIENIRLLNDDGSNTPVIDNFTVMFPSGTSTRQRLVTLATRNGSRAEQLFGPNVSITTSDVSKALRGV